MINLVFCIENGRTQWIEDEFGFNSVTRFVDYDHTVRLLDSFLSNADTRNYRKAPIMLLLKYRGETHLIDIHRIYYIEIEKRIVDVHVAEDGDRSYKAYAPIRILEKALGHLGFVRVSRFYLASVEHIKRISGKQIKMDGGKELPVGRAYRKQLLASLRDGRNVYVR